MRGPRTLLVSGLLAALLGAQAPTGGDARTFAVHCGRLYTGDGTTVLTDAWLVVRDGKVASVGQEAPPAGLRVIDARHRVVMPGIVAVDSDLSGAADGDYAVTPDFMAIDGFDFEAPLHDALEGGVTTAYLSPGRERLVSGQGAVVKTHGRDRAHRVLAESACLRLDLGNGGVLAPRVFEPTPHPTDDDPLLPARIQAPTARIGMLDQLRGLFAGAAPAEALTGPGPGEDRYDPAALRAVAGGALPLRAAAWEASDIRRALLLQHELGAHMVLENPQEIAPLAARAHAQGVAAVFRMPVLFGRANPGGEDRSQQAPKPHLDAPAKAAAAGLPVGIAPCTGVPMRDYLLAVGLAVRYGLPAATALRAVGADAAKILGVDGRVGTLQPGKDADFVVLSGEPLAIGTMVDSTWVDGELAFERHAAQQLLAIRCARIRDGNGHVYEHGVLVVQDGRIKAVGSDLAVPYGARLVELPDAVMTPGFVDAFSHLGLAGEGTGVPNGQPGDPLDLAVQHDDPMFAPALAAGVTTLLVSGKDGGLLAGRVAALKTGASDQAGMVVRAIAGQRAVFDAIGPDADKPLRELLERGRKYAEQWAGYRKALADWKSGKTPAAPAPQTPAAPAPAAPDPVSGTWEATIDIQGRFHLNLFLDLKLDGTRVTGRVRMTFGEREIPAQEIESGSFEAGRIKLEFRGMGGTATLEGTIADDTMDARVTLGPMGEQTISARRIAKEPGATPAPAAAALAPGTGEPQPPKVDDGLEPLRAVFEQRGALVVRCRRSAAVQAVVALLEHEQVPYVLHDAGGVLDDHDVLGGKHPPVLLEPQMVQDDDKELVNVAAELAELGLPLVFGTGDCAGARFLPLHAAYAVRYGLDPNEALAALTSHAARAFRIDDRVGSLEKGKDADFVVFSGDPFEPTSRVLLVGCNGRIAVDHRDQSREEKQ